MFRRLATLAGTAAALVAFIAPSTASAKATQATADACPTLGPVGQYFSRFGDDADYALVPGGDFENDQDAWTLKGARAEDGALTIARGGSATSPVFCVTVDHPSVRLFSRSPRPFGLAKVEVVRTDAGGDRSQLIGGLLGTRQWTPSMPMLLSSALSLAPGEVAPIQLRFTALKGDVQIDDVYVDPARAR